MNCVPCSADHENQPSLSNFQINGMALSGDIFLNKIPHMWCRVHSATVYFFFVRTHWPIKATHPLYACAIFIVFMPIPFHHVNSFSIINIQKAKKKKTVVLFRFNECCMHLFCFFPCMRCYEHILFICATESFKIIDSLQISM